MTNQEQEHDFGVEERVEPGSTEAYAQWFQSRVCEIIDPVTGESEDGITAGWHIEAKVWPDIDKECKAAGLRQVRLEQTSGTNTYWLLGSHSPNKSDWGWERFFPLALGMYTEQEMKNRRYRAGVVFGWERTDEGLPKKKLKLRVLCPIFSRPIILVFTRSNVNDVLPILGEDGHYRVLLANDRRRAEQGKPTKTPYWGFYIDLGPGKKETRKNQSGTKSSIVSPVISKMPVKPLAVSMNYLDERHVSKFFDIDMVRLAARASVPWSIDASLAIYANEDEHEPKSQVAQIDENSENIDEVHEEVPYTASTGQVRSSTVEQNTH